MEEMLACVVSSNDDGTLSLNWKRNDDVIREAAFLDGKYLVYTSEGELTNDDLFERFKSRDRVEKRISTLKGPVVVRPIFLHDDDRILGLLFGTMTALLLYGLAELLAHRSGLQITGEEIQKQFRDYSGSVIVFEDGSQVVALPQGNNLQRLLHQAMNVTNVARRITVRSAPAHLDE
jgi:transposase